MLKVFGILAMTYLGLVAQSSLVPGGSTNLGGPFFPALLLVMIAACCGGASSVLWSGLVGLLLDGMSNDKMGVQLILAVVLALMLQWTRSMWGSQSLVALVAMVMVVCLSWRALSPMTLAVLSGRVVDPQVILTDAIQDATWSGTIAAALILVGRGLMRPGIRGNSMNLSRSVPRMRTAVR